VVVADSRPRRCRGPAWTSGGGVAGCPAPLQQGAGQVPLMAIVSTNRLSRGLFAILKLSFYGP